MGSKKTTANAAGLPALKIGGRVRRTDDGVEGRIVWANGVSVKVAWDGGEQVTWRRDSLAGRPIAMLAGDEDQPAAEQAAPQAEQETTPEANGTPTLEGIVPASEPAVEPSLAVTEPDATNAPTPTAGKPKHRQKETAEPQQKKLSALDAAARVLAETGAPMSCKELIGAMAGKGYWTSPGGKTPDATLCSAILREIKVKGEQSRFVKAAPGRFALRTTA